MCVVSIEIGKASTVVDGNRDSVEGDVSLGLKQENRGLSPGKYDLSPRPDGARQKSPAPLPNRKFSASRDSVFRELGNDNEQSRAAAL